jgi:hypothetical protein
MKKDEILERKREIQELIAMQIIAMLEQRPLSGQTIEAVYELASTLYRMP